MFLSSWIYDGYHIFIVELSFTYYLYISRQTLYKIKKRKASRRSIACVRNYLKLYMISVKK